MSHPVGRRDGAPPSARSGSPVAGWVLLLLALPGGVWALYTAVLSSAALFGEAPTSTERATSVAAFWSGASLWLVTAVAAAAVSRRFAAAAVSAALTAFFALMALGSSGSPGPFSTERTAGWLTAWWPPTSWAVPVVAVVLLVRSALRARR